MAVGNWSKIKKYFDDWSEATEENLGVKTPPAYVREFSRAKTNLKYESRNFQKEVSTPSILAAITETIKTVTALDLSSTREEIKDSKKFITELEKNLRRFLANKSGNAKKAEANFLREIQKENLEILKHKQSKLAGASKKIIASKRRIAQVTKKIADLNKLKGDLSVSKVEMEDFAKFQKFVSTTINTFFKLLTKTSTKKKGWDLAHSGGEIAGLAIGKALGNTALPAAIYGGVKEAFRFASNIKKGNYKSAGLQALRGGLLALGAATDSPALAMAQAKIGGWSSKRTDRQKKKKEVGRDRRKLLRDLQTGSGTIFKSRHMAHYKAGTNYVPETGPAMLHEGEQVVPKGKQGAPFQSEDAVKPIVTAIKETNNILSGMLSVEKARFEFDMDAARDDELRAKKGPNSEKKGVLGQIADAIPKKADGSKSLMSTLLEGGTEGVVQALVTKVLGSAVATTAIAAAGTAAAVAGMALTALVAGAVGTIAVMGGANWIANKLGINQWLSDQEDKDLTPQQKQVKALGEIRNEDARDAARANVQAANPKDMSGVNARRSMKDYIASEGGQEQADTWASENKKVGWAGWKAKGGSFSVNSPTLFGAGEDGPEDVVVIPKGSGMSSSGFGTSNAGPSPLDKNTIALKDNTKATLKQLKVEEKQDQEGDMPGLPDTISASGGGLLDKVKSMFGFGTPAPTSPGGGSTPGAPSTGGGSTPGATPGGAAGGNYSKWLGMSYKYGAEGQNGQIDCSSLTQQISKSAGVSIPRTAQGQFDSIAKNGEAVGRGDLKPGDLLFFADPNNSSGGRTISHTGVYLGRDQDGNEKMLHSGSKGSQIVDFNKPYYQKYFYSGARPNGGGGEKIASYLGYGSKSTGTAIAGKGGSTPKANPVGYAKANPIPTPSGNNVDNIVNNTKSTVEGSEPVKLQRRIAQNERARQTEAQNSAINNNTTVIAGGGGTPTPNVTVTTGDQYSFAGMLARNY
jgi:cell wall-associated NlpC family hydrolase